MGACRLADSTCSVISKDATHPTPGFSCLQSGGIFVPNATCQSSAGLNLNFDLDNAYYVWNRVINEADGTVIPADENAPPARGYVSDQTTQSAVDWIRQQNADGQTWMATVSYANDHTPYQQPPRNLLPIATPDSAGFSCTGNTTANEIATRIISNQMIEAMDTEIGNLLVQSGLATMDNAGRLQYDPAENNTMVIIIGDNGTFAPGVKVPFDFNRAKGYVYQTGVWVPLIVSGPLVASPGREVTSMVNIADRRGRRTQGCSQVAHPGFPIHAALPDERQPAEYSPDQFHADLQQHPRQQCGAPSVRPCNHQSAYLRSAVQHPAAVQLRGRRLVRAGRSRRRRFL
jgi:hypothetical protein